MEKANIRNTFKHNKHFLLFLLFIPTILTYFLLQQRSVNYTVVHIPLDDSIPFMPIFIIPYISWYLYIPLSMLYLALTAKRDYIRQSTAFFLGTAVCLILFIFFPTCIDMRPEITGNDFLSELCKIIFSPDKPVNICPSMHCYEALCIHLTLFHRGKRKHNPVLRILSFIEMTLICLSTVFVKQHSAEDMIAGILIAIVVYIIVYKIAPLIRRKRFSPKANPQE